MSDVIIDRSSRADVRNPLLALPAMGKVAALSRPCRTALSELLGEIAADASERAQLNWRRHKAPMAAYWKAVAVYAGHLRRAIRRLP